MKSFLFFFSLPCVFSNSQSKSGTRPVRIQLPSTGTSIYPPHIQQQFLIPKQKPTTIPLKNQVVNGVVGFHIPTEAELHARRQVLETEEFLRKTLPAVFPTYINCQTLDRDDCVYQDGCSWCKWPTERCQYTDVASLLPTQERCVEGGIPFHPDQIPDRLCGDAWFEAC